MTVDPDDVAARAFAPPEKLSLCLRLLRVQASFLDSLRQIDKFHHVLCACVDFEATVAKF